MLFSQMRANVKPIIGKLGKSIYSRLYEKSKYTTDLKLNSKFERKTIPNMKKTEFTLQISFKLTKK